MLIEPTESETLEEMDRLVASSGGRIHGSLILRRFCDAMIQIRKEVDDIVSGKQPKDNNLLRNAPHPLSAIVMSDKEWNRCAFDLFTRIDNADTLPQSILSRRGWLPYALAAREEILADGLPY